MTDKPPLKPSLEGWKLGSWSAEVAGGSFLETFLRGMETWFR